jgi:Concanavalin A-like lectin/glucanases superfamily/Fibronectin type III domain
MSSQSASISFVAPASNGGASITGYTVTSNPGNVIVSGSNSPIVVTGLTNGTPYTFTVHATNINGNGPESVASNSVTPSLPGGIDPYYSSVSLLLHGTGANGSTSIIDNSSTPKTVTAVGNSQVSTTQSKFGGGSLYFDGSGDYVTTSENTAFNLATNNTFEAWIYPISIGTAQGVLSYTTNSHPTTGTDVSYIWFIQSDGTLRFAVNDSGGSTQNTITTTAIQAGVWTHIAVVKNGTNVTQYINGVSSSTATITGMGNTTGPGWGFRVGSYYTDALSFNGYIDEVRITTGVARYTANFTVPTSPFPDQNQQPDPYYSNVALLLHGDGVNGSTQFIDSSSFAGTLTASGSISQIVSNKMFGSSSINIPNNISKIDVVKSSAVDLTGTYTIEFWARTSTVSVGDYNTIISTNDDVYPNRFVIDFGTPSSTTIVGRVVTPSNVVVHPSPTQPYALGDWAHFAFVNDSTANTHSVFINGVSAGSRAAIQLFNATTFQVGKNSTSWVEGPYQIDDLRITTGVARYTANFNIPTAPFPDQ